MSGRAPPQPLSILLRNLLLALAIGVVLFVLFTVLNRRYLAPFTGIEILLFEAGAIVLIAYLVARGVTDAINALMARRGGSSRAHAVRLFLNVLVAIGAVLALFSLAGVSIESIFLGSALAGIVLGLAAQTVLANVFAGVLLVIADPFRPGDQVSLVSSSYGAIWPSYPHEMMYPSYSGTVEDVGLIYTVLRVDSGGIAKVPNSVVLAALVLRSTPGAARAHRVRMTFPQSVRVDQVESAIAGLAPLSAGGAGPPPRLEVADISATTWDGVVVLWAVATDEGATRDLVLRSVLGRLASPAPGRKSAPPPTA